MMRRREAILPDGLALRLAAHVKAGHRLIDLSWDVWYGVYFLTFEERESHGLN